MQRRAQRLKAEKRAEAHTEDAMPREEAKATQRRKQSKTGRESCKGKGTKPGIIRWEAPSYIEARKCAWLRSPRSRSEKRTSSASNSAHSSDSRAVASSARVHNAAYAVYHKRAAHTKFVT